MKRILQWTFKLHNSYKTDGSLIIFNQWLYTKLINIWNKFEKSKDYRLLNDCSVFSMREQVTPFGTNTAWTPSLPTSTIFLDSSSKKSISL